MLYVHWLIVWPIVHFENTSEVPSSSKAKKTDKSSKEAKAESMEDGSKRKRKRLDKQHDASAQAAESPRQEDPSSSELSSLRQVRASLEHLFTGGVSKSTRTQAVTQAVNPPGTPVSTGDKKKSKKRKEAVASPPLDVQPPAGPSETPALQSPADTTNPAPAESKKERKKNPHTIALGSRSAWLPALSSGVTADSTLASGALERRR